MRRSKRLASFALAWIAAFSAFLMIPALRAQVSPTTPRIVSPVDEGSRTTLRGNVTALARPEFDRGAAAPETRLTHVRLVLSRSPEQEAALDQLMAQQLDKSSPNYHHWLTPQQFGALYGPADSDIAAIVAWLQSCGLEPDPVAPGRTNISFSGTVAQIEQAFHTPIHAFNANGEEFLSNTADPQIPAALAGVVTGVAHLNTLQPKPHHIHAGSATYDTDAKRIVPFNATVSEPRPALTNGSAGNYFLYVVAGDAATIYNTPNSLNANFSNGTSYTGTGVTIGIAGNGAVLASTVQNYRKLFIGDTNAPTITNSSGVGANSSTDEAYLDLEISGALAPGAAIHFYTDSNLFTAIDNAVTDNTVDILSVSFGACELNLTTSDNLTVSNEWKQAAAQGIAVTISSGDNGSAGCDDNNKANTPATNGLAVNGLGSTQYNVSVGGTDYYGLLTNFTTYADTSSSSSTLYRSAKSYIPEATWNDSTSSNGLLSANTPYLDSKSQINIVAGSGGKSSCSTNTSTATANGTCTSGWSKPTWQRGAGVPADGVRDLPDISLLAGNGMDNAAWLVCTDDTYVNSSNQTVTEDCSGTSWAAAGFGGTSASAPAFAGILALVQQKVGSRLGIDAAKVLYDLYNGPHASAVFHDVTTGNISVVCAYGTIPTTLPPNCAKNTAGSYFMTGYDTGAGYDLATGLGSLDTTALITYWGAATGSTASTVKVTPANLSIVANQALNVAVTVSGSAGTPTGTVTLSSGTYVSSAATLTAGAATIAIPANSLAAGTDTLTVTYSGDSTYATGTGTATVTVTAPPTPTVTVTPASTSINSSQSLNVTVAVAGTSGTATGTVTLKSGSYTSAATALSSGSASITIPANSLAGGTATLTATYSGDSTYGTATGTATVTVAQSTYTLAATTPAALKAGASTTSAVTVTSSNAYSGSVSLACALTTSPTGASNVPSCSITGSPITLSSSTTSGTATVSFTTTAASAVPATHASNKRWLGAGSGTVLAMILLFGIPARRRRWHTLVGALVLLIAFAGLSACGGGGSSSGSSGQTTNPGTTAGTYTFTITGTGTPAVTPAPTTTITLTIN